jgi:hypothetical protein
MAAVLPSRQYGDKTAVAIHATPSFFVTFFFTRDLLAGFRSTG